MANKPYEGLAKRLHLSANGLPPTDHVSGLDMLTKLLSPEEADLAAQLGLKKEAAKEISGRFTRVSLALIPPCSHEPAKAERGSKSARTTRIWPDALCFWRI